MNGDPDLLYNAFAMQFTRWFQMRGKTDPLAGVNVREEYELVRQKKSMLSSFKRRMVVARYERFLDKVIAHPKTEEVSEGGADKDCAYCDGTGTVRFMSDGGMTEDACGMCDGSGKEL